MIPPSTLTLRWMPGTTDRVHFDKSGRTFTVLLRDVQHLNVHTFGPLYLRGSVTLPVSAAHLSDLMGHLRRHVTPSTPGTDAGAWVAGGGLAGDEPQDGAAPHRASATPGQRAEVQRGSEDEGAERTGEQKGNGP